MANKAKTTKTAKNQKPDGDLGLTKEVEAESKTPNLTDKQRLFVEHYLSGCSGAEAARRAGYSQDSAYDIAYENLRKPDIQAFISERVATVAMAADEVLIRLAKYARGSLEPFVADVGDDVWPDLTSDEAKANFGLLKKIKPKRRTGGSEDDRWTETEIELEIHDPLRALELIGRHHKLFTDSVDLTNSDGSLRPTAYQFVPYVSADTNSA